jgi:hypothetical protein
MPGCVNVANVRGSLNDRRPLVKTNPAGRIRVGRLDPSRPGSSAEAALVACAIAR